MDSWQFYKADINSLKFILESYMQSEYNISEDSFVVAKKKQPEGAPDDQNPTDAHAEAKKMKEQYGNFKTAYLCINENSIWQAKCIEKLTQPIWTHTTERVKTVTGPAASLQYEISMSCGEWQAEVADIVAENFASIPTIEYLELEDTNGLRSQKLTEYFDLVCTGMKERARSLAHHQEPPRAFAAILQSDTVAAQQAYDRLAQQWQWLMQTEEMHRNRDLGKASALCKITWTKNQLVRYSFLLIECAEQDVCKAHMNALFSNMGDEKLIEDIHQHIRDLDRAQRQNVTGLGCRMVNMLCSNVLSSKAIDEVHASDDDVVRRCTAQDTMSLKDTLNMNDHAKRVPSGWQRIQTFRSWESPNNESLYTGLCAWNWITFWWENDLKASQICIDDGWASVLLQPQDCIRDLHSDIHYLVLVAGPWACIAYELEVLTFERLGFSKSRHPLHFLHVHSKNLGEFAYIPCTPCTELIKGHRDVAVHLKKVGKPQSIVARALDVGCKVSDRQLAQLWSWLSGDDEYETAQCERKDVLERLIYCHFEDEQCRCTAREAMGWTAKTTVSAKLESEADELLGSVMACMRQDPDNFKEFESLQTAFEAQRKTFYKQQLAAARQKGKEAKAAKAKAKAKGKAKAKAKANGKGRGRGKGKAKGKAKGKGKAHALGRRWLKRRRLEGALQDLLAIFAASLVYTNSWVCFRASVCTGIHCNS